MYIVDENKQKITINNIKVKENYDDSVVIGNRMIKKTNLIIAGIIVAVGITMLGYFVYKYQQEKSSQKEEMEMVPIKKKK